MNYRPGIAVIAAAALLCCVLSTLISCDSTPVISTYDPYLYLAYEYPLHESGVNYNATDGFLYSCIFANYTDKSPKNAAALGAFRYNGRGVDVGNLAVEGQALNNGEGKWVNVLQSDSAHKFLHWSVESFIGDSINDSVEIPSQIIPFNPAFDTLHHGAPYNFRYRGMGGDSIDVVMEYRSDITNALIDSTVSATDDLKFTTSIARFADNGNLIIPDSMYAQFPKHCVVQMALIHHIYTTITLPSKKILGKFGATQYDTLLILE